MEALLFPRLSSACVKFSSNAVLMLAYVLSPTPCYGERNLPSFDFCCARGFLFLLGFFFVCIDIFIFLYFSVCVERAIQLPSTAISILCCALYSSVSSSPCFPSLLHPLDIHIVQFTAHGLHWNGSRGCAQLYLGEAVAYQHVACLCSQLCFLGKASFALWAVM